MTGQLPQGVCSTLEQWPGGPAALGGESTDMGPEGRLALGRNLNSPQTSKQPPLRKINKSLWIIQVKKDILSH